MLLLPLISLPGSFLICLFFRLGILRHDLPREAREEVGRGRARTTLPPMTDQQRRLRLFCARVASFAVLAIWPSMPQCATALHGALWLNALFMGLQLHG